MQVFIDRLIGSSTINSVLKDFNYVFVTIMASLGALEGEPQGVHDRTSLVRIIQFYLLIINYAPEPPFSVVPLL
jgi:hypothetical protein